MSTTEQHTTSVKPIERLSKSTLVIDFEPTYVRSFKRSDETYEHYEARLKDQWAIEFTEFIKDHRSQDPVHVYVKREYEVVCSKCGRPWEPAPHDDDPDKTNLYCAWCGEEVQREGR